MLGSLRAFKIYFNKNLGITVRGLKSFTNCASSNIRNLAVVAHIDSGKTTLTESILLASNFLSSPGSVDTGSTTTDFLPVERERGITIQSASIPVKWKDWSINLIDTPGHADFGMEVESASRVVDGALVLIDSVEGVEAQTKGVWRQLDRYGVPTRMIFLNKMDRPGSSFRSSILSIIHHNLHPRPMVLTLPITSFDYHAYDSAEPGIEGIVDLVAWEIWKWGPDGVQRTALPHSEVELEDNHVLPARHPLHKHLLPARISLLDNLSMFSQSLLQKLLDSPSTESPYLAMKKEDIIPATRSAVLKNEILPVICGSALNHIGTDIVLDYACLLLASPADYTVISTEAGDVGVQAVAWKVSWDKRKGWMTFVRVYSGTLKKQMTLMNVTQNQQEKVSKLLLLYADQPEEVHTLSFGSIGVILGFKYTRTGDILLSNLNGRASNTPGIIQSFGAITPPRAVMSASVIPQTSGDAELVQNALVSLSRTDPSVRVEVLDGQLLFHGLGALHMEIVEGRLRDEWGVNFEVGERRVSYREGLGKDNMIYESEWKVDSGAKSYTIAFRLNLKVLVDEVADISWDGNLILGPDQRPITPPEQYRDKQSPLAYIANGLSSVLSNSPHTSLPLSNLYLQVEEYKLPHGCNPAALIGASSAILRDAIIQAGMGPILEPYVRLKVEVAEDHLGQVIANIAESGGVILELESEEPIDSTTYSDNALYVPPAWMSPTALSSSKMENSMKAFKRAIHAEAPLHKMLNFYNRLRAVSGGHGTFEMQNSGFKVVAQDRRLEILREIGKA